VARLLLRAVLWRGAAERRAVARLLLRAVLWRVCC